jgi:2-polyprenyl-6-methoxyphenol hydroxylase-like FAD-dependent oxidoreductase
MDIDVLVVGAGPTGLMLANQLGRRGVRVLIIDRSSGPAQQTRAMAVHARTLEIYSKLGVSDRAVALGKIGGGVNAWAEGKHTARIPFNEMGKEVSPFPYVLMLGQDDNERILGAHLEQFGIAVQWSTELVSLEQQPSRVVATLKKPDGSFAKVEAQYVAGCDGGRSAVRELNRIGFPGAPYEHVFFVADTVATGSMRPAELNVYLWRNGFHLFFPIVGENRWRVIGILPTSLNGKPDLKFEDVVPHITQEAGTDLSFESCSWFSTYKIHHRRAERFQLGRCFLLGDAAHVHSPMGGQGMNTGLQDAYNLAWKLALVVQGRAEPVLLESYEAERTLVANNLLATTDRAFRLLVSESRIAGVFRTKVFAKVMAFAMSRAFARRVAFATLSQTGIRYPSSALSSNLAGAPGGGAPRAGDRFPWLRVALREGGPIEDLHQKLDDTRFNLVLVSQPAPERGTQGLGDLLRVHAIAQDARNAHELARHKLSGPAFYLLRPDGHVGLAGSRFDAAALYDYLWDCGVRLGLPRSNRVTFGGAALAAVDTPAVDTPAVGTPAVENR